MLCYAMICSSVHAVLCCSARLTTSKVWYRWWTPGAAGWHGGSELTTACRACTRWRSRARCHRTSSTSARRTTTPIDHRKIKHKWCEGSLCLSLSLSLCLSLCLSVSLSLFLCVNEWPSIRDACRCLLTRWCENYWGFNLCHRNANNL